MKDGTVSNKCKKKHMHVHIILCKVGSFSTCISSNKFLSNLQHLYVNETKNTTKNNCF